MLLIGNFYSLLIAPSCDHCCHNHFELKIILDISSLISKWTTRALLLMIKIAWIFMSCSLSIDSEEVYVCVCCRLHVVLSTYDCVCPYSLCLKNRQQYVWYASYHLQIFQAHASVHCSYQSYSTVCLYVCPLLALGYSSPMSRLIESNLWNSTWYKNCFCWAFQQEKSVEPFVKEWQNVAIIQISLNENEPLVQTLWGNQWENMSVVIRALC